MSAMGGERTLALDAKRVVRISAGKVFNVAEALRERLSFPPARVIDETEPCHPERANLGPLLLVRFPWHSECAAHPMKVAAALWTLGT